MTVSREPEARTPQAGDVYFCKQMATTRKEFLRNLARAFAGRDFGVVHDAVIIREANRCLAIRLQEQREHRIGALRLPSMRVEFRFSGYSKSEADRMMMHIDRHFQRGGG